MQISRIHASVDAYLWAQALFSYTLGQAEKQAHQCRLGATFLISSRQSVSKFSGALYLPPFPPNFS